MTGRDPAHDDEKTADARERDPMGRLLSRPLTEDELRDQTERVARPLDRGPDAVRRVVTMRLGRERLALPVLDVVSVTTAVPVHRVPHRGGALVRGLCNIGGELVLTASLARLLQIDHEEPPSADRTRMVTIGATGSRWTFAVDEVEGVEAVEAGSLRELPVTVAEALVHFAESIVPLEDGQATLLDPQRIVSALEAALA